MLALVLVMTKKYWKINDFVCKSEGSNPSFSAI